jgi:uncharacterized protein (UPF0335 family)
MTMTTKQLQEAAERIKRRETEAKELSTLEKDALDLANYYVKMLKTVGAHAS